MLLMWRTLGNDTWAYQSNANSIKGNLSSINTDSINADNKGGASGATDSAIEGTS